MGFVGVNMIDIVQNYLQVKHVSIALKWNAKTIAEKLSLWLQAAITG